MTFKIPPIRRKEHSIETETAPPTSLTHVTRQQYADAGTVPVQVRVGEGWAPATFQPKTRTVLPIEKS